MALNTLESDNILRQISYLKERIAKLEAYFQGTPIPGVKIENGSIDTAKIKDAAITNAKIDNVSASKIETGTLSVVTTLGGASTNASVTIDGVNNRIMVRDESAYDRILIGKQTGGF